MTDTDGKTGLASRRQREVCSVLPARLGERGDINRSYSADLIASSGRIRNPFPHKGDVWVCTSICGRGLTESGETEHEAYRLTPPSRFIGVPTSYGTRTGPAETAEAARSDPFGFYHGIVVKRGSEAFVMSGPPVRFVADASPSRPDAEGTEPMQLTLF